MIVILYCKCKFYVPSFHPYFFNELKKRSGDELQIIDVSMYEIEAIKDKVSKAELVALDQSVHIAAKYTTAKEVFFHINIASFVSNDHYRSIWDYVVNSNKRVLYLATFTDLHAINNPDREFGENFKVFFDRIDGIAWIYPYKMIGKNEIPEKYRDNWMDKHGDPLDHWEIVMGKKKVNIGLHHCLHPKEILKKEKRKLWKLSIIGASYSTRRIAIKTAEDEGIAIAPYNNIKGLIDKPANLFYRFKFIKYGAKTNLILMKPLQDFIISHSAISYTCGSSYKYFVRKYLEIPSKKSLLLCDPCIGLSNYGFINERSCINIEPDEVGKEVKFFLERPQLIDSIVKNATDVLLKLHTVEKRVDQFIAAVNRMEKNTLREAKFIDGEYILVD